MALLVRFLTHPAWLLSAALTWWLAARGEMGADFNGPWFGLFAAVFAIRSVVRASAEQRSVAGHLISGMLLGLLVAGLGLAGVFTLTYRCSRGLSLFEGTGCTPDPSRFTTLAVALSVVAVLFAVVARVRSPRRPTHGESGGDGKASPPPGTS
ncbi:MAG: hypothetical protein KKE89_06480 [Actinobacteria bacterium]|nr:hypothetical protein [Actinomycetota bacterium]